jgi:type I restriction enzyme R subunit
VSGTPFDFLRGEFPQLHEEAVRAGEAALRDPRASCFYVRRGVELAVRWAFEHDRDLREPYEHALGAYINAPSFKDLVGQQVFLKVREAVKLGNRAAHHAGPISVHESVPAVSHLFEFLYWFARTYAQVKPPAGLAFDPKVLPAPRAAAAAPSTLQRIKELEAEAAEADQARARAAALAAENEELAAEIARLQREVAEAKRAAAATPDEHDYSESQTREYLIDLLLRESGWDLAEARDREFEVHGMPNNQGVGYADYVLWGADGKPMAVIEAKRTGRSPAEGQQQARLYADCLERMFGQRPVVFYSNGFETWLWDEAFYPPRRVQGFPTRAELELMIQRRATRRDLTRMHVDEGIAGRFYQTRAITRVAESFERDAQRKALLVMATGAGKTRTVIALTDLLMRANWVKRVLFLADRTALVTQAGNAFKSHLPDSAPVNLVTEKGTEGRVYVSTYPTMMNLINEVDSDGRRRFGPNHFDLVVIDEAHRSVFHKYKAIFDYFDSLLVGLTATPRSEIEKNTYDLFDLETGVPTDEYGLEQAVADGFLVPFRGVSVPLRFQREGIRYDDLSEDEKEQWDELDWDEDGGDPPDEVSAAALNQWLFNTDTVDKVLAHLMANGATVDGGARLGKTIVFAKNQRHAEFIAQRFDANYPHHRGEFARVITHGTEYAQDLIEKFSNPNTEPRIAISVDMLDTGIDIPEVINLVFFKQVRSKAKFWQMIGRGTRLCPDLLGPGADKEFFYVFDYCQNLEYFNQDPGEDAGSLAPTLAARAFQRRVDLVVELDRTGSDPALRGEVTGALQEFVGSLNPANFVVRPQLRLVEKYQADDGWVTLGPAEVAELTGTVAHLPDELPAEPVEARQFDVLMLDTQLALLRGEARLDGLQERVRAIAALLEAKSTIPVVAAQLDLLQELQIDDWWTDATPAMLERARLRVRGLTPLIDKARRNVVYTDFTDELGDPVPVDVGGLTSQLGFEQFRKKAQDYLRGHLDNPAVAKLRNNEPLTTEDLAELEVVLIDAGVATPDDLQRAVEQSGALGVFIRSLVGVDRNAAKQLFADFLDDGAYSADQIHFVNMVIDELTANGVVPARRFYESPYVDITPEGPEALFPPEVLDRLFEAVAKANETAQGRTGP